MYEYLFVCMSLCLYVNMSLCLCLYVSMSLYLYVSMSLPVLRRATAQAVIQLDRLVSRNARLVLGGLRA
jgi:hypothetical protein